ncbi:hypothetical protein VHEMI08183 [[Torrubiella] hemipterigena]|uniref:DUF1742-domain-containing protein n=1 Tax=[Torrubiella] hemipterigena TaxID=1531966 RepID=A0A0A1TCM1_9HYPO|nr:hypothetical protein VHEMI08183 [[Torrubiella] hemipterigena]
MIAPFANIYNLRKVAEASAKACDTCYKPTTSVLITPDKKDFFYICDAHLKDKYFCNPKIDEEAVKAKREKKLAEATEKVKKEYEEKMKKKKEKEEKKKKEEKEGDKDKDKEKDAKDTTKSDDKNAKESESESEPEEAPRVFELKTTFYQQRLLRKRQLEAARRDRERVSQPGYFPSVPSAPPSK